MEIRHLNANNLARGRFLESPQIASSATKRKEIRGEKHEEKAK
jgi:hypothetical protein